MEGKIMNCTHPVLYHNAHGALACHICGAVLADEGQTDKNPSEAAKPTAGQKTGNKRTRKKTTDDETV
jgi:hypothetical protein